MSTWINAVTGIPDITSCNRAFELTEHIISSSELEVTGETGLGDYKSDDIEVSLSDENNRIFNLTYYDGNQKFSNYWGPKTSKLGNQGLQFRYSDTYFLGSKEMKNILRRINDVKHILLQNTDKECVSYVYADRE